MKPGMTAPGVVLALRAISSMRSGDSGSAKYCRRPLVLEPTNRLERSNLRGDVDARKKKPMKVRRDNSLSLCISHVKY